ncbi:MAG TPA: ComF family protein [Pseudoneobacillus sp.]|nr:ComF family protein [Pseudoneobacillus sp.]
MSLFRSFIEQNRCLICFGVMEASFGWMDFFIPNKKAGVCQECQGKLQRVEGDMCQICGRSFAFLHPQFRSGDYCYDCIRWEENPLYKGILNRNYSFYLYNDFLKEIIAKFKYRGDYVLARVFAEEIAEKIKEIKPEYIIPIPLSEERLSERGFNQAEALIVEAGFPAAKILTRIHSEKQSKKSRNERIHLPQVFQSIQSLSGKIMIIDDIYTTGSTLRHAAKALKEAGAEEIYSITIARG